MLERPQNPSLTDENGLAPLHMAAGNGSRVSPLVDSVAFVTFLTIQSLSSRVGSLYSLFWGF